MFSSVPFALLTWWWNMNSNSKTWVWKPSTLPQFQRENFVRPQASVSVYGSMTTPTSSSKNPNGRTKTERNGGKITKKVYIIGSLRNPEISKIAQKIRSSTSFEVFDDWMAAGPEADDYWKKYEQEKGNDFVQALKGAAARNVFEFDKAHLDSSDAVVLVLPAGRSGHLELGYALGSGKPGFILLNKEAEGERFDVMYGFATGVTYDPEELPSLITSALR